MYTLHSESRLRVGCACCGTSTTPLSVCSTYLLTPPYELVWRGVLVRRRFRRRVTLAGSLRSQPGGSACTMCMCSQSVHHTPARRQHTWIGSRLTRSHRGPGSRAPHVCGLEVGRHIIRTGPGSRLGSPESCAARTGARDSRVPIPVLRGGSVTCETREM